MKSFRIRPAIKKYDWGMNDSHCWVAGFSKENSKKEGPYAEAWFGDHLSGSATLEDGQTLADAIRKNPSAYLSSWERKAYGGKASLLPKVLSIAQPLSIQLHPKPEDAKRLHAKDPEKYPDPFDKEEASIALTEVWLLHSLLRKKEIDESLKKCPELSELLSGIDANDSFDYLERVLSAEQSLIEKLSRQMIKRLRSLDKVHRTLADRWTLRTETYYPDDRGLFCFYLFNIVSLEPGEAIALNCGVPHAYLSGELLEVMKPSDNVIRCGLTAKFIDEKELMRCISRDISSPTLVKAEVEGSITAYRFLDQGFEVSLISNERNLGEVELEIDSRESCCIAVSLNANATIDDQQCKEHDSFFIGSSQNPSKLSVKSGRVALFSRLAKT